MAALELAGKIGLSAIMAGSPAAADMPRAYDSSILPQGAIEQVVNQSPIRLDFNNPSVTIFQQEAPASPFPGPSAGPSIAPEVSPTPNPVTGELPCPTPSPEPERTEPPFPTTDPNIGIVSGEALAQTGTDVIVTAQEEPSESIDPAVSPAPSEDPQTAVNPNCEEPTPSPEPTAQPDPFTAEDVIEGKHPAVKFGKLRKAFEGFFSKEGNEAAAAAFKSITGFSYDEALDLCEKATPRATDFMGSCMYLIDGAMTAAQAGFPQAENLTKLAYNYVYNGPEIGEKQRKDLNSDLTEYYPNPS